MKPIKWSWKGREAMIVPAGNYRDGSPCLAIVDPYPPPDDTDQIARLTVCIDGVHLAKGEYLVKTWGENEELAAALLRDGVFVDTLRRYPTGYVTASVWRLP